MIGARRILIVEDEPLVHDVIRRMLRGFGFDIVGSISAEQALKDCEQDLENGRFDLVLLDVFMPGIPDGVDFFRRLKKIDEARAPAVVFITGDPHAARALGAWTACVGKPFSAEALQRAIGDALTQIAIRRHLRACAGRSGDSGGPPDIRRSTRGRTG